MSSTVGKWGQIPSLEETARRPPSSWPPASTCAPHLPTYPPNFERAIRKDHEWYARTQDRLKERFAAWLNE